MQPSVSATIVDQESINVTHFLLLLRIIIPTRVNSACLLYQSLLKSHWYKYGQQVLVSTSTLKVYDDFGKFHLSIQALKKISNLQSIHAIVLIICVSLNCQQRVIGHKVGQRLAQRWYFQWNVNNLFSLGYNNIYHLQRMNQLVYQSVGPLVGRSVIFSQLVSRAEAMNYFLKNFLNK